MVCPKCRRRWEDGSVCPDDRTPLVRVSDVLAAEGDPMIGRTLEGRFTILSKLGAGSMGAVYRARQHAIGREVAINRKANPEHLARYPLADLFLDTSPYGAHTTASDALWMGG
jgi:hypothetical protein